MDQLFLDKMKNIVSDSNTQFYAKGKKCLYKYLF